MSNKKIWFITGAGRGMGADFAKAALAAGHAVVATGRNSDAVSKALGQSNELLSVTLDVTRLTDAEAAVRAAIDRFGRIDVLVNNAASFYAGYFEELTPEQFERQLSVSLIGPMNVTRAVLPVMRKQRSGHIISISSSAGLAADFDFVSAYAASKFGLEGWMESLHAEVAPFGISTTVVNPGFFRTELLTEQSTNYAERPSRTTTSVEGRCSSIGSHRTGSSPATPRSSRRRSSQLPARSRRRTASSPAPMRLPRQKRKSPISGRRSRRTETSRRRSPLTKSLRSGKGDSDDRVSEIAIEARPIPLAMTSGPALTNTASYAPKFGSELCRNCVRSSRKR